MARNRSKRSLRILLPALTLAASFVFPAGAQSNDADQLTKAVIELYAAGKYESALPLARQALEIQEKALGLDHPEVATALNNLASIYRSVGQYALAESLYRRALLIDERALGPEHAQVARDLSNLGSLYDSQNRYADAEPLYKWALATDKKALGPDHPDVASDLSNLASVYGRLGRYPEAESSYKQALAIQKGTRGIDHPDVAVTYNNLGALYESEGRAADAESNYKMASALQEGKFDHPEWSRNYPDAFPEIAESRRQDVPDREVLPSRSHAPVVHVAPVARVAPVTTAASSGIVLASAKTSAKAGQSSEEPLSCEASVAGPPQAVENFLPWPPPKGSDAQDLTNSVLSAVRRSQKTDVLLGDVDKFITERLTSVGLKPSAYFSTPDHHGYAAVTRLEQIDENGRRLEGRSGFSKELPESGNFLWRFFSGLVSLPEGHFRLLVAFVTTDPIDTWYSSEPVTLQVADRWVSRGCDDLPVELGRLTFTDKYKIFLRVYQIASKGGNSHLVAKGDAIPISEDLVALGLRLDDQK
jgi:tetratricopeptide (TPR) repeat protein